MTGLCKERHEMEIADLIHSQSKFPVSSRLPTAVAPFGICLADIVSLSFNMGPFE
jgi:hypothetical protein